MFGFVMADMEELTPEQQIRYKAVYCGLCRRIRLQCSNKSRMALSYDMAFLALLLLSLYEPEEETGIGACKLHPLRPRPWVDHPIVAYCADMNVAPGYYKAMDDYRDDKKYKAKAAMNLFAQSMDRICMTYPRQCKAIEQNIQRLASLEKAHCSNPDEVAACFGNLMAELFVYKEDNWQDTLRQVGSYLGRFIYFADAAIDFLDDTKKQKYNPFIEMKTGVDWDRWEEYLVLSMGRCTDYYERLPLVQDKNLLDNILYSGIWLSYRQQQRGERKHGKRSL